MYYGNLSIGLCSFCFGFSRATISIITYSGYFQEYSLSINQQTDPVWTLEHEFNLLTVISDNAISLWSNVAWHQPLKSACLCYYMLSSDLSARGISLHIYCCLHNKTDQWSYETEERELLKMVVQCKGISH